MALPAQLSMHTTGPVGPVALSMHTTNLANQRRVGDRPLRRPPRGPRVVARPDTSSTRHIVETAWFAFSASMNRNTTTGSRSP